MLKKAHDEVQMEAVKLFAKAKESTDGLKMGEADFKRMFSKAFSSLPDDLEGIKNKIHSFEAKAKCLDNPMQEQVTIFLFIINIKFFTTQMCLFLS